MSEKGKNWFNRIANPQNIDTDVEKGLLLFGNIKDGEWSFYTNGVLERKINYRFGDEISSIRYWPNGNIRQTVEGGLYRKYDDKGLLDEETRFVNGRRIR